MERRRTKDDARRARLHPGASGLSRFQSESTLKKVRPVATEPVSIRLRIPGATCTLNVDMALDKILRALNRYGCRLDLDQLREGPKPVTEIAAPLKLFSRPAVSQALALLLDAGLISRRRQGRLHYYQLRPTAFQELARYIQGLVDA